MVWILALAVMFGINFSVWMGVGIFRFISERITGKTGRFRHHVTITPVSINEVAALIPAHNEELTLGNTIGALLGVMNRENIFVANDRSTDATGEIARSYGVNVYDISPNVGKARAIVATLRQFRILDRYKAVLINDADVEIDRDYMKNALPLLFDDSVAAVAGYQEPKPRKSSWLENYILLYRVRLWVLVQYGMRFGQTWKYTNVSYIIPGSLSIYKSSVLKKLDIDAPGLIIEDFNMTFEVHKKRLGKIAYSYAVRGYHQDPYTLADYFRQVRRWNLGFWQTVIRNGIWPGLFWLSLGEFIIELFLFALYLLLLPFIILSLLSHSFTGSAVSLRLLLNLFVSLYIVDYGITVIIAAFKRQPLLLVYGLFFFLMRFLDAYLYVFTIPLTMVTTTTGVWTSPKRKYAGVTS